MSTQTKAPEVQTISSERGTEYLREVLILYVSGTTHSLRIRIKLDPYAIQCYARVALWDGSQWHSLHEIHYAHMSTKRSKRYVTVTDFDADRSELLRVAAEVLA